MGRKLSFAGKITAMLLSLVLIINSVGLTVLASDVTSLDGSRKIGENAGHVDVKYAVLPEDTTDFTDVPFYSQLNFSIEDDLRRDHKLIFVKTEVEPGYTLTRFWYRVSPYAWTSADDMGGGYYKFRSHPEVGTDISVDITATATEYHVSFVQSDRYTFSNIYKNGDSSFDPETATVQAWDDTISFTVSAVDGCSINSVTATRDDNGENIPITETGVSWSFTVPDSSVTISVDSSSDIYYCPEPGAAPVYLEPSQYKILDDGAFPASLSADDAAFYVIRNNITMNEIVSIEGNVNLIICDGKTLTAAHSLYIGRNSTLTVYGQTNNTGKLVARTCLDPEEYWSLEHNDYQFISQYAITGRGTIAINGCEVIADGTEVNVGAFAPNLTKSVISGYSISAGLTSSFASLVERGHTTETSWVNTDSDAIQALSLNPYARISACNHPVSSSTHYVQPGTEVTYSAHEHMIGRCAYCLGGTDVIQEHVFDGDGHCACNTVNAYRIIANDDSVSYSTSYENGSPNEWFINNDTAVVRITPPAGYASRATFTNQDGTAHSYTGSGSFLNPYKVSISGGNVYMDVETTRIYDIYLVSTNGNVRVLNFFGDFTDTSTDRVASAGSTVSLQPVSDDGYTLGNIVVTEGDNNIPVTRNTSTGYYEFEMPAADVTVTATFIEGADSYTITVPDFEHGFVRTDKDSAAAGESVSLAVTAELGYHLASLSYGKGGTTIDTITVAENQTVYSIVMPASDITISATFEPSTYTLTYPSDNNNYIFYSTSSVSFATDETVEVSVMPAEGVHIYGLSYKYELDGREYIYPAVAGDTWDTGFTDYSFTMPAADVELIVDYGYNITVTAPQFGLSVTCNGEAAPYARAGETIDVKWVGGDFRIHHINVNNTSIAGSTFTMPAAAVTLSVEQADCDPLYVFETVNPAHGRLVLKDSQGHETDSFIAGEEVYVELIPDDRYRLQCSSLDIDIQYATRRGSQIFTSDNYTFHSTGKYTLHFTCEAVYEGGFISLRDGVTYDHLIPNRYKVNEYVNTLNIKYITMDSADAYYYPGSTVTLTLNTIAGQRLTALDITQRVENNNGEYNDQIIPHMFNAYNSTITFTMPENDVYVRLPDNANARQYFYYDPFTGRQNNLDSSLIKPWAAPDSNNEAVLTVNNGWYSTGEARSYDENTIIKIGAGKTVNILVCDGDEYKLDVAAIVLEEGATLMIYGQSADNNGTLICNAANKYLPGIGAMPGVGNATIAINGCNVTATGGNNSSGIGRGAYTNSTVENNILVSINHGNVTAYGGSNSAGIGGSSKNPVKSIYIREGSVVNARGGANGAGIGGGANSPFGSIIIGGGDIVAYGGSKAAGIGGGRGTKGTSNSILITKGTITASGSFGAAAIGNGGSTTVATIGGTISITGGAVEAYGCNYNEDEFTGAGAGIGGGAYTVSITGGVTRTVAGTTTPEDDTDDYRALAIGRSEGGADITDLVLGDEMKVIVYPEGTFTTCETAVVDRTSTEVIDHRITDRHTYICLEISPCGHDGVDIDYVPGDIDHHQEVCPHCLRNSDAIAHSFDENGNCACGAFQVKFDGNGGSGTMDPIIVEPERDDEGHVIPVNIGFPECGFETDEGGMVFTGWKIEGGDDTVYYNSDITVSGPVTLVAQWNSYLVSVEYGAAYATLVTIDGDSGASFSRLAPENSTVTIHVEVADGYRLSTVAQYVNITSGAVGMMNYLGDGDYSFVMPQSDVVLSFDVRKTCDILMITEGEGATLTATSGVEDSMTYEGATVKISIDYTDENASLYSLEVKCGDEELEVTGIDPASPYDATEFEFEVPYAENGVLDDITVTAVLTTGYVVTYATQTSGVIRGAEDRYVGGADHKIPAGTTVVFETEAAEGYLLMNVSALATPGYKPVTITALGSNLYSFVMPENNVTVGATFIRERSISYDANGGSGVMTSTTVHPGTRFLLPANSFEAPAGAEFIGWTINDGTDLYVPGDEITIGSDVVDNVIHAQWKSTWTAVQNAISQNKDVTLLNNIFGLESEAGVETYVDRGNLTVASDKDVTIDLNGFSINRKGGFIGDTETQYHIFDVAGKLTIVDSSEDQTGKLIGSDYGVFLIGDRGTQFILNGGSITGLTYEAIYVGEDTSCVMNGGSLDHNRSGVMILRNGKFKMTGGIITENTAGFAGPAVEVQSYAEFEMTGGTITGNTIRIQGTSNSTYGAVVVEQYATMKISGNPVITGNYRYDSNTPEGKDSNLYLRGGNLITVTGDLDDTALMGVDSSGIITGPITSGLPGHGSLDNFYCDKTYNDSHDVGLTLDGEAILGFDRRVKFHAGGGSGTMANDIIYYYDVAYTIPECTFAPPEGKVFDKWIADDSPYTYVPGDRMVLTVEYVQDYMDHMGIDFDLTATWKDDLPNAIINSVTASFEDKIRLNFYIDIPQAVLDGAYVTIECGEDQVRLDFADAQYYTGDNTGYKFSYTLFAYQIEDIVNVKVLDANGNPITFKNESATKDFTETGFEYSLLTYVNNKINNGSATMKKLAQAAKDYCYAVRNNFLNTESELSSAVGAVTADQFSDYASVSNGTLPAGVSTDMITALFESDNSFRLYLKFDSSVDPASFTYLLDGHETELMTRSDGKYYLTFTGIASGELHKTHTFTITDGESTYTYTASVLTYARAKVNNPKSSDAMVAMCDALLLYNQAAIEHFGVQ